MLPLLQHKSCLPEGSRSSGSRGQQSLTYHPSASGPVTPGMRPAIRPCTAHAGGWQAAAAIAAAAPSRVRRSKLALLVAAAGCAPSLLRGGAAAGAAARRRWVGRPAVVPLAVAHRTVCIAFEAQCGWRGA